MPQPAAPRGPLHKIAASVLFAECGLTLILWPVYCWADGRPAATGLGLALINALPLAVVSGALTGLVLLVRRPRRS